MGRDERHGGYSGRRLPVGWKNRRYDDTDIERRIAGPDRGSAQGWRRGSSRARIDVQAFV
jgi:hypothetical protein